MEQIRRFQFAVDHHTDEKRVDSGNDGSFRRRHDACLDAAENDDGHAERPAGASSGGQAFLGGGLRQRLDVILTDHDQPGDDERCTHQNAGNDTRKEKLGDRDVGGNTEDDEGHGWRDDRGDDAAGGDETAGARNIVTGLCHHRDEDCGKGCGIGCGRAGNAGHDDGCNDGHDAETATDMTDERDCKVDDAAGQAAGIHQFASQDEKGNGKQGEGVRARDHVLGNDGGVEHAHVPHEHDAAEHQRERDGNANRHGSQQRADKNEKCHGISAPKAVRSSDSRPRTGRFRLLSRRPSSNGTGVPVR